MKPPTKFELMRRGRERAFYQGLDFGWAPLSQVPAEPEPTTAARFMKIDGARYVEAPSPGSPDVCAGCAFAPLSDCFDQWKTASDLFGGSCGPRGVIYIKAE